MSDDTPAIDRSLLRRLDWAQLPRGPQGPAPGLASDPPLALPPSVEVTAVIEAVHDLATLMSTMAERVRVLEAHAKAFATSNDELEAANRQLTVEIDKVVREHKNLAAGLAAEGEQLRQLERYVALGIARATALNHDLTATHANLARIIDAVGSSLAAHASASAEDPTTR